MTKPVYQTAEVVYFKALEPESKADQADPLKGEYEAIVSVIGNVDRANEKVLPGAFEENLAAWKASGDPIPSIWSHQWDNPLAHLGVVTEAEELKAGDERLPERIRDKGGLYVKSTVDADLGAGQVNVLALAVLKGMKQRTIKEFSFAYKVEEDTKEADGSRGLKKLQIMEVGPALKGVNPATQLMGAKSGMPNLSGSFEERREAVRQAVRTWTAEKYGGDGSDGNGAYSYVEGTYENRVVFTVEKHGDQPETLHFEASYQADENTVLLSQPKEVDLQVVLAEKALRMAHGLKAGRVLNKANEGLIKAAVESLQRVLDSLGDETNGDDPSKAEKVTGEGRKADESESDGPPPPVVRAQAEMEALLEGSA